MPERSFRPSVMRKAEARATPSPIQAVFHSHIFLRQMSALGVECGIVGPGTKSREIRAVITPGATTETTMSTPTETVSPWSGKEMEGS